MNKYIRNALTLLDSIKNINSLVHSPENLHLKTVEIALQLHMLSQTIEEPLP